MKSTLVIFQVPGGSFVSCPDTDLSSLPQQGSCYLFSGRLYEVEQTIESLGPQSGDTKLMELVALAAGQPGVLPSIRDLSSTDGPKSLSTGTGKVLLVRLRAVKKQSQAVPDGLVGKIQLGLVSKAAPAARPGSRKKAKRSRSPRK